MTRNSIRRIRGICAAGVVLFLIAPLPANSGSFFCLQKSESPKNPPQVLLAIHKEIQELGYRKNEDFLKREFHFDLDGCWDNREEHIMVLSHKDGDGDKMILQVTYFGKAVNNNHVRYPELIREVICLIEGDAVMIKECAFDEAESRKILPDILKGIQYEKKLLRLIENRL